MEAQTLAFHQAVQQGYLSLAAEEPERWLVVDATRTIDEIHDVICSRALQALRQKGVT
jgi:dTMP kinase